MQASQSMKTKIVSGKLVEKTCLSTRTSYINISQEYAFTSCDGDTLEGGIAVINYSRYWIIDSGCSHHVTSDVSLLSSQEKHKGNKAVVTSDSSVHPVKNKGCLKVKTMD